MLAPFIAFRMTDAMGVGSAWWGFFAAVGLFASVALHELGHSIMAIGRGYPVRDIVLTPIGGVAFLARSPRRPNDELIIALAGPFVSVLLFISLWASARVMAALRWPELAGTTLFVSYINLALALFNMLPSFPMDGGRVYRAWLAKRVGRLEATRRAVRLGKIFAVLFAIVGLFENIFLVIIAVVVWQAASAEYRIVQMQERPIFHPLISFFDMPDPFRPPPPRRPEVIDVEIGPPPYER